MNQNGLPTPIFSVIAFLLIGHFVVDFMLGIWPIYKTMADVDIAKAGLITGVCALIGEGAQLLFGPLGDRGYYRKIAALGVMLALGSTLLVYTSTYIGYFFLFLLTYVGSGAFHPSSVGLISTLARSQKAMIIPFYTLAGAVGLALSQITFTSAYFWFGGETVLIALFPLLVGGALFFLPQTEPEARVFENGKQSKRAGVRHLLGLFRYRDLRLLYVVQVCAQSLLWGIIFLLPDILSQRSYATWICFGGGHLAFMSGMALVMIPAGYLASRYSARLIILVFTAMGGAAIYTFLSFPFHQPSVALSLLFLTGASIGAVNPVSLVLGSNMVPKSPGTISAFLMGLAWCVAEALGPIGGGAFTKLFEEDPAARGLAMLCSLYFVSFGCMYAFRETVIEEEETVLS